MQFTLRHCSLTLGTYFTSTMLEKKVCLVTGASRGIGRGIALQLGRNGATVYITGRKPSQPATEDVNEPDRSALPSLQQVAEEINESGGRCIPVYCDHTNDGEVEALFEQIKREQEGKLDVLVNNAYAAVVDISANVKNKFWESDPLLWDKVNNVGLRNHYICSVYGARLMTQRRSGIIINISSVGGLQYLFNVPYGVGKAACDRMAADCAVELKPFNVAFVSVWPGPVRTELSTGLMDKLAENEKLIMGGREISGEEVRRGWQMGESTQFAGLCIAKLVSNEQDYMSKTGKILFTGDLASQYGIKDIDGRTPALNGRRLCDILMSLGWERLASFVPGFINVPKFALALHSSKF